MPCFGYIDGCLSPFKSIILVEGVILDDKYLYFKILSKMKIMANLGEQLAPWIISGTIYDIENPIFFWTKCFGSHYKSDLLHDYLQYNWSVKHMPCTSSLHRKRIMIRYGMTLQSLLKLTNANGYKWPYPRSVCSPKVNHITCKVACLHCQGHAKVSSLCICQ